MKLASIVAIAFIVAALSHGQQPETFMGLIVALKYRCSSYDRGDYPYPQSVELDIIEALGGVYGPYTGACFSDRGETDIEHIVAVSEVQEQRFLKGIVTLRHINVFLGSVVAEAGGAELVARQPLEVPAPI